MENLTEQDSALRTNFQAALRRLLTNKLYMWNFFSSIFIVFAFMGFGTFMPKYVEFQFRSKHKSNFLKGESHENQGIYQLKALFKG